MKNTIMINHDTSLLMNCAYIYDDEALEHNEQTLGGIPGMKDNRMLPGYFLEPLEKHTLDMLDEVM
ncbi:MAG: hypothetical protein QG670_2620 [Thermoproteota archaeon]|nr:hypothetical protein [Thermoproteota archaeon]